MSDRLGEIGEREPFLFYLKPCVNGCGNYYIEARTRDQTRTDVIVDCLGKRYVIELKVLRRPCHDAEGERQVSEYLDCFDLSVSYLLSFNSDKRKAQGVRPVRVGDKLLYEGTLLSI